MQIHQKGNQLLSPLQNFSRNNSRKLPTWQQNLQSEIVDQGFEFSAMKTGKAKVPRPYALKNSSQAVDAPVSGDLSSKFLEINHEKLQQNTSTAMSTKSSTKKKNERALFKKNMQSKSILTNDLKVEERRGTMKKHFNNQSNIQHKKTASTFIQQNIHKASFPTAHSSGKPSLHGLASGRTNNSNLASALPNSIISPAAFQQSRERHALH